MNIKTNLTTFFIFLVFGVSFSAYASQLKVTSRSSYSAGNCEYSVGDVVTMSYLESCANVKDDDGMYYMKKSGVKSRGYSMEISDSGTFISFTLSNNGYKTRANLNYQVVACENEQVYNPDSGVCEDPTPYCEQSSTMDSIFSAEQSCAADGGVFSYQCHNGNDFAAPSLETTCNQPPPDTCIMGFPNWPDCLDDYNPTDPITPPDGGFVNPDSSNGNSPDDSFNKPEPDPVTPTDTTDTALLEAFQNMNRDNNQALGHISEDINKGNADIKNKLDDVKNSTNAVGQSIVDQMNQDYQIAQQNRKAISDQNMIIGMAAQGISDSVLSASGDIVGQVGFEGSRLNDTLNDISEKICDPEIDERNCEGENGLSYGTASQIIIDIGEAADKSSLKGYDSAVSAAQGFVNDSGTSEIESVISSDIDSLMGVFPSPGSCSPFSIPSPNGDIAFDCQFSDKAKTLISFILYVYTAWTLISILLSGITPVPNQQPNKG